MKKISLAIDGNEANVSHRVGSNIYAFEIIKNIEKQCRNLAIDVTVLLASPQLSDLPKERIGWHYQVVTPKKFWTQWALPIYLYQKQHEYHLFFTPGHYAPRFCPIPYISSVMDLAFLKYPDQFKKSDLIQLKSWTSYSVKKADKILAISHFTKKEIITAYHLESNKIFVAPPALPESETVFKKDSLKLLKKWSINKPYFLYLGTIQPRKNLIRLIKAYELMVKQLIDEEIKKIPELVIAGKIGWLAHEFMNIVKNSPCKDRIILTGFVSEEEKTALLQHALATLHLGLYEGFGIPVLESFHQKTLAIVAKGSSLVEAAGEAAIYVNPYKIESISKALLKVLSLSPKQCQKYLKKADLQLKKFSFKQSAKIIIDEILNVIESYV